MSINWSIIKSLPELDGNDHYEKCITEKGSICHYMDTDTGLIFAIDEYELFNDNSIAGRKIVGVYFKREDLRVMFTPEQLPHLTTLTEFDLPAIKAYAKDPNAVPAPHTPAPAAPAAAAPADAAAPAPSA